MKSVRFRGRKCTLFVKKPYGFFRGYYFSSFRQTATSAIETFCERLVLRILVRLTVQTT